MNAAPAKRWSLRRRVALGLLVHLVLITLGVLANDFVVNERAEQLMWESLLNAELNHFLTRRESDPHYAWSETDALEMFVYAPDQPPNETLRHLPPGLHDEIVIDGRERVLLIHEEQDRRFALALDISDLEARESQLRRTIFLSAAVVALLLGGVAMWSVSRLIAPLSQLAEQIRQLRPGRTGQQIRLRNDASSELEVIADAMNQYIVSNERFVEREREFINVASHELRTPLAVIDGAVKLALNEPDVPPRVESRLIRVSETLDDIHETVALLLVLAKDPQRLGESNESVDLETLVPGVVEDHLPLARGKDLSVVIGRLHASRIVAPVPMVRSAVGNLIRNAIENTYSGTITVHVDAGATVIIEDPGHGMSLDELGRMYARLARGANRGGGGIGLALISRLCTHLGWQLSFTPTAGGGTRTVLSLAPGDPADTDRAVTAAAAVENHAAV